MTIVQKSKKMNKRIPDKLDFLNSFFVFKKKIEDLQIFNATF